MEFLDPVQVMILSAIGVMAFGKRLPEVARKIGGHLAEFRGWINEIRQQVTSIGDGVSASYRGVQRNDDWNDDEESTAPRFDPPPRPVRG